MPIKIKEMTDFKAICVGKHVLLHVEYKGTEYECTVSEDCKYIFNSNPEIENIVELEFLIRDAAMNDEIEKLNELG